MHQRMKSLRVTHSIAVHTFPLAHYIKVQNVFVVNDEWSAVKLHVIYSLAVSSEEIFVQNYREAPLNIFIHILTCRHTS